MIRTATLAAALALCLVSTAAGARTPVAVLGVGVALLAPGAADCEPCADLGQLQAGLQARPDSIIVYNQQDEARALVDQLELPASQVYIEIRQDTRGVLGLHALRRGAGGPDTLELVYQ